MADTGRHIELVTRADRGSVAVLALNRPEKLNALTPAVFASLRTHVDAIAADDRVGCVVLTGNGRSFSAGHDLGALADPPPSAHHAAETIDALERLPQPTIAKIRGHCFTGGLELALACDLLIASESTLFGDTHGQWGYVPIWGMSVRLPERVGLARAKELMYTSRRINARQAAAIGLVDHSVPDGELDGAVDALVHEILDNSWGTNSIDKALLAAAADMPRAEALGYERSVPFGRPNDRRARLLRAGRFRASARIRADRQTEDDQHSSGASTT